MAVIQDGSKTKALLKQQDFNQIWHAHGESNPGYRRERAMSPDPLVRSQILYPTELRVRCNKG